MKIALFSSHQFENQFLLKQATAYGHEITFFEATLSQKTALLANGFECVCCFVSDQADSSTLESLKKCGVRLVALRSAGYNNVDLVAADRLGITIVRVPAYSPHAVAEYAVGLLLSLNRKIHRAYSRVREQNFSLEGMIGFDLVGKTVGVIGTGRIGTIFSTIIKSFGCRVLAYDLKPNVDLVSGNTVTYVSLHEIYEQSDVISIHVPLSPETNHLIDAPALAQLKQGAILINTGRGALIDSRALIEALKSGHLGGAGLDVYEEEEGVFFTDLSNQVLQDDVLTRLLSFPNVLMTSHQAFLTKEALEQIALITMKNISDFEEGRRLINEVHKNTHLGKIKVNGEKNGKI